MVDRIDLPAIRRMIERESQMGDEEREEVMKKVEPRGRVRSCRSTYERCGYEFEMRRVKGFPFCIDCHFYLWRWIRRCC